MATKITEADFTNANNNINATLANFNSTLVTNYYQAIVSQAYELYVTYTTPYVATLTPSITLLDAYSHTHTLETDKKIRSDVNHLVQRYNTLRTYDSAYIRNYNGSYSYKYTVRSNTIAGRRSYRFIYPQEDYLDPTQFLINTPIKKYNGETVFSLITTGCAIHYNSIRSWDVNYVFVDNCHYQCHSSCHSNCHSDRNRR